MPRVVEPPGGEVVPALVDEDPPVDLVVPEDVDLLALGVVVGAGEADHRRTRPDVRDLLDEPPPRANPDELARLGQALRQPFDGRA